ncbi:MAG: four helix bundle protein [Terriglobia bacterium]
MKESVEAKKGKGAKEFEELHVYQQARALTSRIYTLTGNSSFARDHSLRDQLRRAAVSILSNIAEGFERGTDRAFAQALVIAKGSCGEVRAQITVAFDQRYIGETQYSRVVDDCRRLSAGLAKLIRYLRRTAPENKRLSRGTA